MSRYWVSWYEPIAKILEHDDENGDVVEYSSPEWPDAVTEIMGWSTGWRMSDSARTYCAVIDAPTQATIENGLEGFEIRFINPKDDGWLPASDRFPADAERT